MDGRDERQINNQGKIGWRRLCFAERVISHLKWLQKLTCNTDIDQKYLAFGNLIRCGDDVNLMWLSQSVTTSH